jgi:hypothetical protein
MSACDPKQPFRITAENENSINISYLRHHDLADFIG